MTDTPPGRTSPRPDQPTPTGHRFKPTAGDHSPTVLRFDSANAAADAVACRMQHFIETTPRPVLGLATGGTPTDVYQKLVRAASDGDVDFGGVTTFNLDEYIGLPADHEQRYRQFMRNHLFDGVGLPRERTHFPSPVQSEDSAGVHPYDELIERHGGIGLQLLGIGRNGHIAFNEPGSDRHSVTRTVELTADTIQANARFFADPEMVPRTAVTMGIATILRAAEILVMAVGENKRAAVRAAIEGPICEDCPASLLRLHANVTYYLDAAAAG